MNGDVEVDCRWQVTSLRVSSERWGVGVNERKACVAEDVEAVYRCFRVWTRKCSRARGDRANDDAVAISREVDVCWTVVKVGAVTGWGQAAVFADVEANNVAFIVWLCTWGAWIAEGDSVTVDVGDVNKVSVYSYRVRSNATGVNNADTGEAEVVVDAERYEIVRTSVNGEQELLVLGHDERVSRDEWVEAFATVKVGCALAAGLELADWRERSVSSACECSNGVVLKVVGSNEYSADCVASVAAVACVVSCNWYDGPEGVWTDLTRGVYVEAVTTVSVEKTVNANVAETNSAVLFNEIPLNVLANVTGVEDVVCLLYTSPSPRDLSTSRMPSSA